MAEGWRFGLVLIAGVGAIEKMTLTRKNRWIFSNLHATSRGGIVYTERKKGLYQKSELYIYKELDK
jgi:hypothetical protein